MGYHLITGATGLLGRYLIRDLSMAGVPLAVLVRPTRRMTADQRIDMIMGFWDDQLGRELPRPVVLEGNINEENLGLSEEDLKWATENVDRMIHSAASLSFYSTSHESEPWRSNVGGVKNVLEFCKTADIKKFDHVSTAYVCGLRTGRIMESDVDVGQESGNDYERSKLEAEMLVRGSDQFESLTVFRPAIIIGDSKTGFTNTFHGFYAALQLGHTLMQMQSRDETGLLYASSRFTLNGDESKNLIPVDWVSAVMSYIITHPKHHGKTYHLTPLHPVQSRLVHDVLQTACKFYGSRFAGAGVELTDPNEGERLFYDHIRVYNSYWRDDPVFDSSNTQAAAPHLPCPHVDRDLLLHLSQVAIDMNFSWNDRTPHRFGVK